MEVSLAVAFLAGVVSFASPCCLPLVPAYVGYLVGGTAPDAPRPRRVVLEQALMFVLGFTIVFVALWASVGLVGYLLRDQAGLLRQVGGVVLVVMGLHVARVIDIPLLMRQAKLPVGRLLPRDPRGMVLERPPSRLRSLVFGIVFAAGWTPCVGPILGAVIGMASLRATVGQGTVLLLVYAAGHAVPFILIALGATAVATRLAWFRRHELLVSVGTGGLLVVVGFLMITNLLVRTSGWFPQLGL